MISILDLPIAENVYTFTTHEGGCVHIAASTLLGALERHPWPVTQCEIGASLADALARGDLGVEPPHALRLPEAALERPGIIGVWDEAHISIDGAHRLWRRWQRGDKTFPAYVVPEALWRQFCISGMLGTAEQWATWNKTAQIRTPELEEFVNALKREFGGQ